MVYRKRSFIPIFLILAVLSLAAYLAAKNKSADKAPVPDARSIESAPDISLEGIRHTFVEKGVKKWVLIAASARLSRSSNRTHVNQIDMTFYTPDHRSFRVTADQGLISLESRNAEISGDVVIYRSDFKIYTESLRYLAEDNIIITDKPVRIDGPSLRLAGSRFSYDLSTMKAELSGNVNGIINENLARQ